MVEFLVLSLFLITGVASGWIAVDLYSVQILERFSSPLEARLFIVGIAGVFSLLIGKAASALWQDLH